MCPDRTIAGLTTWSSGPAQSGRPLTMGGVRLQMDLMTDAPTVRAFSADEWRGYRDLRLRALADSPDAFGSTLTEETSRLDAEWARRFASSADSRVSLPLVAEGLASGLDWHGAELIRPIPMWRLSIRCGLLRAIAVWV
jgi:hypothetical protein